jgi:glycolate oxidase
MDDFEKIVGSRYVSDRPAERFIYASDMTENSPHQPDFVVMPETVEEVQQIIQLANERLVPLVPFVTGQNVGGLTIPQVDGAVIVDLKRMDKIIDVDEEGMYIVVEPGVTFGHIRKYLDEHHPNLRYTYPLASPFSSVMANAILQGLCDLSSRYGAMADFVNGLEVVLPTGEIVRAGSGILGDDNWFGRYPLPDLVGLFTGWQGMTGIVTKMALQLWPKKPVTKHLALFTFGEHPTTEMLKEIVRADLIDDAGCMSLPVLKMLFGIPPPVEALEGEPDYDTALTLSGNTELEVSEKIKVLEDIVNKYKEEDSRHLLIPFDAAYKLIGEQLFSWVDYPSDAFKVLTEYDGLTWMGTYIHPKNWGQALANGRKIVEKYGFELMAYLKPMKMMHYGEFKFIIRFQKDGETLVRIRQCNNELLGMALDLKAIPYKTPVWAAKKLLERADPGFVNLVKRVRKLLDPNGIMNPGRLGL